MMFSILSHLKNANENHNKMGCHTHYDSYNLKDR